MSDEEDRDKGVRMRSFDDGPRCIGCGASWGDKYPRPTPTCKHCRRTASDQEVSAIFEAWRANPLNNPKLTATLTTILR